jgi:hypothetical protein
LEPSGCVGPVRSASVWVATKEKTLRAIVDRGQPAPT